jgi:hypothetical protein
MPITLMYTLCLTVISILPLPGPKFYGARATLSGEMPAISAPGSRPLDHYQITWPKKGEYATSGNATDFLVSLLS